MMNSMRLVISVLLTISALPSFAVGTINAATMKFKVYKFAVSTSTACTSPTVVFQSSTGVQEDMLLGPTFGSGTLDPGTYPCLMIEMSKIISTSAATTSGSCTANSVFNDVICNDSGQLSQTIDGTAVTCSGGTGNDQHVVLYITTVSAGSNGTRALLPPLSATDTTSGLTLTNAMVVAADTTVTLKVNYHNFLNGGGSTCSTSAPSFAIQ